MNKAARFYCFAITLNCLYNLKNAFSEETVSVGLNFKGKYSSDISDYEVVVPQRVDKDGGFISHLISHRHSKRSAKDFEFIFYKIPIGGQDYLIELTPNRKLISPGAVVEIHKENPKSPNKTLFNETSSKIEDMFKNFNVRKLKNTDCHFSGTVKGENISKAALSTCYGLAGFIQITKGFYTIEPIAERDPFLEDAYPHILYKTDGLGNSSVCHTLGELSASLVRKRRQSNFKLSLPMFVETLIVMDKTLLNHHQDSDCENYVLTVFNMAFNLFHDASAGLMMSLTIVRIIRLEVENEEMNTKVNSDAEKTLKFFQTWQYAVNPGDDSHPNHHDVAVLLTRVNTCYSPSSCGLLGLTTIGKACDPKLSAALCEDNGLRLGYVIAHEIGHLLGADHDSANSTCNGRDGNGLETVMNPHISLTAQTWSSCSREYFKAFFSSGMGSCFLDEPEEHHFNVQDLLPGIMYNADFQCKHLITINAQECDMGSTCNSLNCYIPGYACIVTHTPPADGTYCGENMWCHNSKCLVVGERPGAVDGNWGEWSAWSDCSRTCGSGVASSVRNCDKPQPSHGGRYCVGERKRYKICAATPCETGRPSFRDIQCGEFNDWIYPEDGKVHTWTAYFFHDENPCTLYCINEEKQVAALRPRVIDGTMCFRGIRDICVGGICKSLPCDLHFESNAVEDACGICHGDGTGCEFSEGSETFPKLTEGLTKLVNIPSGTRNIKVEELSPTLAKIIVKDTDTRDVYVKGSVGMFSVPGSQAWLGMIKKNQEALNIPGPVTKPLSIWIQRLDNVTVKWSMALPAEQQRKPEFAWDFLRWGPCSAKCGPGTQISKPSCMEGKAGLVEDSFCADLEAPAAKVRQCEVAKCEPRWMVGDWKDCEENISKKKERKRVVYCIKPIGEGEGESQIVSDSECAGPKPHEWEPCEKRQKREDIESNFTHLDSLFKADSEFSFHTECNEYLKHYAALSLPQGNSETTPLCPVSYPHFTHYFETPEDSGRKSVSKVNLSSGTLYDSQAQNKVSFDSYKETFREQKIGVSHIRSIFQERTSPMGSRPKKNANWNSRGMGGGPSVEYKFKKYSKKFKSRRKKSHIINTRTVQNQLRIIRKRTRDVKRKLLLTKELGKNFTCTSPDLMKFIENRNENNSLFVSLTCKNGSLQPDPKVFSHKRSGFISLFPLKNEAEPNWKRSLKKSSLTNRKWVKDLTLNKRSRGKNKRFVHRKKKQGTSPMKCESNRKRRRSSRIWKKPKSKDTNLRAGKEQSGNAGGYETKNYLNNLFHDNHPKMSNAKVTSTKRPQKVQHRSERPTIKEGMLVIDKDSAENQEIEIIFDREEAEERKFTKLPRLGKNGRKLTVKGQDVFNLFRELQKRSGREAFYRSGESHTEKTLLIVKVTENSTKSGMTTTESTTQPTIKTYSTSTARRQVTETVQQTTTVTTSKNTVPVTTCEETSESTTPTGDPEECDYDVYEAESPTTDTTTVDGKKNRKKEKKKKKEEKERRNQERKWIEEEKKQIREEKKKRNEKKKEEKKMKSEKSRSVHSSGGFLGTGNYPFNSFTDYFFMRKNLRPKHNRRKIKSWHFDGL